jgi:MoaA/NifB/PqqE/SkfB family radical SAM enzyme
MESYKIAQMATAFAQSWLSYATGGGSRPFSASFVVSNRCNIHCSYCNFPSMDPKELGLDEIKTIFSKLKKLGVKRLGLLGGEPLLRTDILKIIELAKQHDFIITLNSNMLLYDKYKDDLSDVDYFFTSLDGNQEKHVANRGKQNYERILIAIRDILRRGKKISSICVVTDPDISSVEYLLALAEREKIKVHFQPECYDAEIVSRSAPGGMQKEAFRKLWLYLVDKKKEGAPIASSLSYLQYISKWPDYSVTSIFDPEVKCGAGSGFLFIDAGGYAYPCAYTKGKTKGISMLTDNWSDKFHGDTPCTKCIVGPLLEFNLLFKKPFYSVANAMSNIV